MIQRKSGQSEGDWDPYLKSPSGKKLRSMPDLKRFLASTNTTVDFQKVNFERRLPGDLIQKDKKARNESGERLDEEVPQDIVFNRTSRGGYVRKRYRRRNIDQESENPNIDINFDPKREKYLKRQFSKLSLEPTFDQFCYIALKLNVEVGKIQEWFKTHQKRTLSAYEI